MVTRVGALDGFIQVICFLFLDIILIKIALFVNGLTMDTIILNHFLREDVQKIRIEITAVFAN